MLLQQLALHLVTFAEMSVAAINFLECQNVSLYAVEQG